MFLDIQMPGVHEVWPKVEKYVCRGVKNLSHLKDTPMSLSTSMDDELPPNFLVCHLGTETIKVKQTNPLTAMSK